MSTGATRFNPDSYARQLATSGGSVRPKSDYGLAMEAKQRWRTSSAVSHSDDSHVTSARSPRVTKTPERTASAARWQRGTGSFQASPELLAPYPQRRERADASAQARPQPSATTSPAAPQKKPTAEKNLTKEHNDLEEDDEELNASASELLAQLQHTVVQISHQIVAERRRAVQLRKRTETLEKVVAEQDAMLDQLTNEHEAMQLEKTRVWKLYQQELRRERRGGTANYEEPSLRTIKTAAAPPSTTISAAMVDRCVCAEFERLGHAVLVPATRGGDSRRVNPFDTVSPDVAAVLRSLATQVLQLSQPGAPHKDETQQREKVRSKIADEPASPSAGPSPTPTLAVGMAPHEGSIASRTASSSGVNSADRHASNRNSVPPRVRSESSTSVDSSIYEDAATILSDIRARYGL